MADYPSNNSSNNRDGYGRGRPAGRPGRDGAGRRDDRGRGERGYGRSSGGEERGYSRRDDRGERGYGRDSRGEERGYSRRDDRGERGYGSGSRSDDRGDRRQGGRPDQARGYRRDDARPGGRGLQREDRRDERQAGGPQRNWRDDDRRGQDRRGGRGQDFRRDDRGGRGRDFREDRGARGGFRDDRAPRETEDFVRPGLAARADEPETPTEVDERVLPFAVRAELRGLPKDLGATVAAHLVAAGELIDEDPELAYRHAEAARRRAARLPVVREATAETAYAAGEYAVALNEYRALRRMTGGAEYLPVMADCERALGRPANSLKLAKEAANERLDAEQQVEMLLVEAGARDDMGQRAEALRLLKGAIGGKGVNKQGQARLRYAYADLLERSGQAEAARQWFVMVQRLDVEGLLDAEDRINALDGFVLEADLDEDDVEETQAEERETEATSETKEQE